MTCRTIPHSRWKPLSLTRLNSYCNPLPTWPFPTHCLIYTWFIQNTSQILKFQHIQWHSIYTPIPPLHSVLSPCYYLHWLSDLFFYTPQQNFLPLPYGLPPTHQTINSSAYKRPGTLPSSRNLTPIFPIPIFTSFITVHYIRTLKNQGNLIQPCLTPLANLRHSLMPPFTARLLTYSSFHLKFYHPHHTFSASAIGFSN